MAVSEKKKKQKISQAFQRWLLVLVVIAFLATTAFLWLFQTKLSKENAVNLLALNISDVKEDIIDASDENLLELTQTVVDNLNAMSQWDSEDLHILANRFDVAEINYIDSEGYIRESTFE